MNSTSTTTPEVSRVPLRLPPFWPERPDVLFLEAEAQFSIAGITQAVTKFHYIISHLDQRHAEEIYITIPNNKIKIEEGDLLKHHVTGGHQQEDPSYPVKQEMVNQSFGSCMKTEPTAGTQGNSEPDAAGQTTTHTGSSGDDTASNTQQHLYLYKNLVHDPLLPQNSIATAEEKEIQKKNW
jgi:hypothetical protein